MIEVEITELKDVPVFQFSHSRAEGGDNAGRNTWNAAKSAAHGFGFLKRARAGEEFARMMESAGWDGKPKRSEREAIFLQYVAGDIREAGADTLGAIDWEEYEAGVTAGRYAGNIFRGDGGRFYFSVDA